MKYKIGFLLTLCALLIITPLALRSNATPTVPLPLRFVDPANPQYSWSLSAGSMVMCRLTDHTHRNCSAITTDRLTITKEVLVNGIWWVATKRSDFTVDGQEPLEVTEDPTPNR